MPESLARQQACHSSQNTTIGSTNIKHIHYAITSRKRASDITLTATYFILRPADRTPHAGLATLVSSGLSTGTTRAEKHAFNSITKMASPAGSTSPLPKASRLGTELFDAIVQAADPRHPDHAAWQERYGSLSDRSSRASFSSGHKRDKLSSPQVGTPSSRKSLDHTDLVTRRKQASRKAGTWDLSYRQSLEADKSDADDPVLAAAQSADDRHTPGRASFEGSVRSHRSASIASSSHRRRNRRLRDSSRPKPLVPPVPPPRVTSSTNWQSTFGSPSLPELATSSPRTADNRSSSGNTSDIHDQSIPSTHAQRVLISPSAPTDLRIPHPYASVMLNEKEHDLRPLPSMLSISSPRRELPASAFRTTRGDARQQKLSSTAEHSHLAPSVAQTSAVATPNDIVMDDKSFLHLPRRPMAIGAAMLSSRNHSMREPHSNREEQLAPPRKSMNKIRQLLGNETPALGGPPLPEKPQIQVPGSLPNTLQECPPAVPPKNLVRNGHRATGSVPRVPVPALTEQEVEAMRKSLDASRKIDLNVFPLRRDDEFRANDNEFEMSDDEDSDGMDAMAPAGLTQPSATIHHHMPSRPSAKTGRGPGVVRRSLDSIISPFRAGLLNGSTASSEARMGAVNSKSSLTVADSEPIAPGRRSFSDSRFVRPFIPRARNLTAGRKTRPLSKVLDRPEDEVVDMTRISDARGYGAQAFAEARPAVASDHPFSAGSQASSGSKIESAPAGHGRHLRLDSSNASTKDLPSPKDLAFAKKAPGGADIVLACAAGTVEAHQKASLPSECTTSTPDATVRSSQAVPKEAWPDANLPSISTAGSLASMFSRSTGNLHGSGDSPYDLFARTATMTLQQQPTRGKLGGFFDKVKGSMTPKATPTMSSCEFPAQFSSPSEHGTPLNFATSQSVGAPAAGTKKAERAIRNRVKSLTSPRGSSSSRSRDNLVNVPAVPAIPRHLAELSKQISSESLAARNRSAQNHDGITPQMPASLSANLAAQDLEPSRSVWEESPQLPSSSSFPSADKASRSFGRLLRRKKHQEDLDAVIDAFVPLPPKIAHPDLEDEAAPRSSLSSTRGFDVVESSATPSSLGQARTTIRKTLSPALLSDTPQPRMEARFEEMESGSAGHGEGYANDEMANDARTKDDNIVANELIAEDHAEELSDAQIAEQQFSSPLGRFIRGNPPGDRLSRVEELSERLSYISDPAEANADRSSSSLPASPNPRSFGEHRSVRRSVSGNVRGQNSPPALQLAPPQGVRSRKISLDILRPRRQESSLRDATALDSPASLRSPAASSPATNMFIAAPKSPATPSFGEQLTPSWRSTSFSTTRSGRTSFSQDRDRAPVASPISPPLPANRGVGRAMERLGIKGKNKKVGKGISPSDVIVLDFDGDGDENESRPSTSVEPRPSFGGVARPSLSNAARPSLGGYVGPSIEATGRNSLVAAEMVTKLLEVEASGLIPSPVTPSFGSNALGQHHANDLGRSTTSLVRSPVDGEESFSGTEVAGLGIGSVQWSEGMPLHKSDSIEVSGSTSASDGTFTSQGIHTPENGSLSHDSAPHGPYRSASMGATTPLAGSAPDAGQDKTAELLAFKDMLGRFPQQQKVLLQDISARVAKTPIAGGGRSGSGEDEASSSGVFPNLA